MVRTSDQIARAAGPGWSFRYAESFYINSLTGVYIASEVVDAMLEARIASSPGAFGILGLGVVLEEQMVKKEFASLVAQFGHKVPMEVTK